MHWAALFTCVLAVSVMNQVSGLETVTANYGETVKIPCNNGLLKAEDIDIIKWKDDTDSSILVKRAGKNATIGDNVNYKTRVSIQEDFSLVITKVIMADQRTFTCLVSGNDILEFPVQLQIYKAPSQPQITNQASVMEIGKMTVLAQCRTEGANPAAVILWIKNKATLSNSTVVKIITTKDIDSVTGLSATTSTLEYAAAKEDIDAKFICRVQHPKSADMDSSPLNFTVNYPTEKVELQVVSKGPFMEGDNVTLKCTADGNPPPTSYNFYIKGEKKAVENSNTYTLRNITRAHTGEYKCSLVDKEDLADSKQITVDYLEVVLSSTGKVVKKLGESFETTLDVKASGTTQTSWKKDKTKLESLPKFDKLKYSDSGVYEGVVTMNGLVKTKTFELIVEGAPVIKKLIKKRGDGSGNKVLSCEAEGFPKPTVQWSINTTKVDESEYKDGQITYSITLIPKVNLTVSCTVSNALGYDVRSINVSTIADAVQMDKQDQTDEYGDQTAMVIGIIIGVLLALLAIALAYWLYLKKYRQGTWKTGEKEDGSAEESKKLEESQKADV
nr:activated leukocyte cell adhesion molecule b [Misgurnus anguillicaudatus]